MVRVYALVDLAPLVLTLTILRSGVGFTNSALGTEVAVGVGATELEQPRDRISITNEARKRQRQPLMRMEE